MMMMNMMMSFRRLLDVRHIKIRRPSRDVWTPTNKNPDDKSAKAKAEAFANTFKLLCIMIRTRIVRYGT